MPAFILLVLLVGAYLYATNRRIDVRRQLKRIPKKSISEVQDGETVRISGSIVLAGKTLVAPLSKRPCAYYHVVVKIRRRNPVFRHSSGYYRLIDDESTRINDETPGHIVIRDGEHYAWIDTRSIKTYLEEDKHYSSGFFKDATPEMNAYLARFNSKSTSFLGMNETMKYSEALLEEDEQIVAAGKAQWVETKKMNIKLPAKRILYITATDRTPVYLSEDPDTVAQQ